MSTQQIVGTALFVAGAFTGNYQLMIYGATLAAAPKPQDTQGPRLGDLKVQTSTYGTSIPRIYGSMRFAGNMIWSAPIVETPHTQSSGGKGGGPTNTSYTYSQSFAIALCEGEIVGVRKIWANGKLIYNLAADASLETITASNASAAGIRIYTGSETQEADSLIEAYEGDTPAYRGTAYVIFENLQLQDYGNRAPNLEFEVVEAGGIASNTVIATVGVGASPYFTTINPSGTRVYVSNISSSSVSVIDTATNTVIATIAVGANPYFAAINPTGTRVYVPSSGSSSVSVIDTATNTVIATIAVGSSPRYLIINPAGTLVYVSNDDSSSVSVIDTATNTVIATIAVGANPYFAAINPTGTRVYVPSSGSSSVSVIDTATNTVIATIAVGANPYFAAINPTGTRVYVSNYSSSSVSVIDTATNTVIATIAVGANPYFTAINPTGTRVYVSNISSNSVSVIDTATNTVIATVGVGASPYFTTINPTGTRVYVSNISSSSVSVIDTATNTVIATVGVGASPYFTTINPTGTRVYVSNNGSNSVSVIDTASTITTTAPTVASIVSDLCSDVGLTAINTSALTDTLTGYMIPQRSTARAAIEPLAQAFFFDAVESDGIVKFIKRGGASVVAIPQNDLAAHEYGSTPPDPVALDRKQEVELPVEITINYSDADAAYLVGSQYARRLTGSSENKSTIQLAMAISASKAKQVADVLMYDAWQGRVAFKFQTTNKYSYLEPSDVVQIQKSGTYLTVRIVDKDEQGGIITFSAVHEDLQIYDQNAIAPSIPAPDESVQSIGLTNLQIMDIPLLRDQDDGEGFYAAACGYSGAWGGAQMFKSSDSGESWVQFGRGILNDATIGTASTALGNFGQNIFDETNSVTVVLLNGTLSSITELAVLNGGNVALLGDEILQFRDATLTAANTYLLTGLLRGRQGTEWAMSTHAIGDRFVLLESGTTYLMPASNSEFGVARKYVGVTFGGFLEDAIVHDFTFDAVAQECYSPVQLGGGRNVAGDLTLNWIRRTRIGGTWTDYADVPLGEATEAYEVEIYDGSGYATVVRTITGITGQTTSYTAAQQTTDFGSLQATVYWKAYQLSATNGRGYEARGIT